MSTLGIINNASNKVKASPIKVKDESADNRYDSYNRNLKQKYPHVRDNNLNLLDNSSYEAR